MATSSERGAARRAPGAPHRPLPPPPPEEVAAFYALVEKSTTASMLGRHTRCAEFSDRAARHAERLWGNNSLVVADLRVEEAAALRGMARASTSSTDKEALLRRAWAVLVPVHALLLRRLADNTLLPGTIKEEEVTYYARSQAFAWKAADKPVPSEAVLQRVGVVLGYETLLRAVFHTLNLLDELRGSSLSRESARSFVLTALDAVPRTATLQAKLPSEAALVDVIETLVTPQNFEPSFCASQMALKCCGRRAPRTWRASGRRGSKPRGCCGVQNPPTRRHREDRAARVRVAVLRQG